LWDRQNELAEGYWATLPIRERKIGSGKGFARRRDCSAAGLVRVIARLVQPCGREGPGSASPLDGGNVQRLIAVGADWKGTKSNSLLGMRNAKFGKEPEGRDWNQGALSENGGGEQSAA
jgi:hypothetical protein